MARAKDLGIWMDHLNGHLMEFTTDPIQTKTITSQFTHEQKGNSLGKSDNVMHTKEQHQQSEYFKRLGETIRIMTG